MELTYTNYITKLDMRKKGYDLEADGVLDVSHFATIQDAIDDFLDETVRTIYNLVIAYRGREFADNFFTDMTLDDLSGKALDFQQRLKRACLEQAIFNYDNGDVEATYQEDKYKSPYAPKAVKELWDLLSY